MRLKLQSGQKEVRTTQNTVTVLGDVTLPIKDEPGFSLNESLKSFIVWEKQKQVLEWHAASATQELANAPAPIKPAPA
ncbi:hypothetical protein HPB50_008114 [Hyalomma asiaticum]|uniref:Uncharacterized protein n=1 Tax=Hyalomma asiaticum TaxID=266040 RepID=A0ACB7S593_HYAAI|nr:hypothetical protein HPB50_008114 [Hyalomma asiaticum]